MHSRGINRGETLGNPVGRFEGVGSKKDNGHKSAVWLVDIDFETPRTSSSGSVAGMVKGWGGGKDSYIHAGAHKPVFSPCIRETRCTKPGLSNMGNRMSRPYERDEDGACAVDMAHVARPTEPLPSPRPAPPTP